jgi:ATP-dependent helicase/nuclease subunit B
MLTEMLERGLVWTPVPSSPRGADSVRVVPIVGGPPPAAPVVFVFGLCERSFPREIISEPFFKDRERRLVTERGKIVLDERSSLSSGERFFFYFAVSRATGRLVLTYPTADGAGKELARSHYVEEVVRLFSDLTDATEAKAPVVTVAPELATVADANELRAFVACQLSRPMRETEEDRDEGPMLASLAYNELLRLGGFGPDDLVYQVSPEKLSEVAGQGPGNTDTYFTSVSELETFGRCPFRHFCEYRLGLEELRRYEFGPAEEGMLYHEILARLYREIYLPSGEDRGVPEEADAPAGGIENLLPEYVDERLTLLMDELLREGYSRLFRPRRMQVRRRALHARIRDFVLKELENERANATRPTYFELSFGKGKSQENADRRSSRACLTLRGAGPAVRVSGRMDRVDVFTKGVKRFGVVVDYKRSIPSSRLDLQSGTVLQPGIYMLALKELFGLRPAGAFYYAISSGRKRGVFAKEDEESISGQGDVSRTDRVSYEEIGELMKLNARQAVEYVQRILEGEKAVRPADRNECRACPFRSVCRISEQTRCS